MAKNTSSSFGTPLAQLLKMRACVAWLDGLQRTACLRTLHSRSATLGEHERVSGFRPFGRQQGVAVLRTEMRNVDFGHRVGRQHGQPVTGGKPRQCLARLQNGQRTFQAF